MKVLTAAEQLEAVISILLVSAVMVLAPILATSAPRLFARLRRFLEASRSLVSWLGIRIRRGQPATEGDH